MRGGGSEKKDDSLDLKEEHTQQRDHHHIHCAMKSTKWKKRGKKIEEEVDD